MNIDQKIADIDAEVAKRTSPNFGIKFGSDLYLALIQAGKIKKAKFSILGTGAFEMEMPAYDGKYAAWNEWEIEGDDFEVGTPRP